MAKLRVVNATGFLKDAKIEAHAITEEDYGKWLGATTEEDEAGLTEDEFHDALRRVSRPTSESDEASS